MSLKKEAIIELHPAFHWFGEFANHIVLKDGSLYIIIEFIEELVVIIII